MHSNCGMFFGFIALVKEAHLSRHALVLLEIGTLYACSMLYPSPNHIDIVVAYKRWGREGNRGRGSYAQLRRGCET